MDQRSETGEMELYRAVDEVLHYMWDPIGIRGRPEVRDEYQSYIAEVIALLHAGAETEAVADFLVEIETVRMGLGENRERAARVANALRLWRQRLREWKRLG